MWKLLSITRRENKTDQEKKRALAREAEVARPQEGHSVANQEAEVDTLKLDPLTVDPPKDSSIIAGNVLNGMDQLIVLLTEKPA